ncbi:MAG: SAM-dependent chlorinase/fluorinase [Spirochaetota bacterium]
MIVLLTDFGNSDPYVGIMKGVIRSLHPTVEIVDLTHEVPPQNIAIAAFILQNSYSYFPRKTIFVLVVDPGVGTMRKPVAIHKDGYYFVGPDNGCFAFLQEAETIVELNRSAYFRVANPDATFHGRDIFSPIAAHLANGLAIQELGDVQDSLVSLSLDEWQKQGDVVIIPHLHTDHFGNLIYSFGQEDWQTIVQGRTYWIEIGRERIASLSPHYQISEPLIAIFNSYHLFEIASPNGSAAAYLKEKGITSLEVRLHLS